MHRAALGVFAVAVGCLFAFASVGAPQTPAQSPSADSSPSNRAFTEDDMRTFLAAKQRADKIGDPLQRCLRYPDPPGSHWTPAAVAAYCHFRLQPVIDRAELKALLDSGRGSEIDQRLMAWQREPKLHPEPFWRMFSDDFMQRDSDTRAMLEAWKQQSPKSAFAYAASGYSFLLNGWDARGSAMFRDTPQANIDAMDTYLARADGDLRRAIKLDPSLSLPYAGLIEIGTMQGDDASVEEAIRQASTSTSPSLPVYEALALAAQPRWGGSRAAQARLLGAAQSETTGNPLLFVVRSKVLVEQLGIGCYCTKSPDDATYRKAFDQVASRVELYDAGSSALENGQYQVATVYLAEASRFGHPLSDEKLSQALAHVGTLPQAPR